MIPIPGCEESFVTKEGKVFVYGKEKKQYLSKDGYLRCAVRKDNKWVTLGVHRLMALAYNTEQLEDYLAKGYTLNQLVVNHIDFDKRNNVPGNIEWCTDSENQIHRYLFSNETDRICLTAALRDDHIHYYKNIYEASKALDIAPKDIWKSVKLEKAVDNWRFYYVDSRRALTVNKRERVSKSTKKKVVILVDIYSLIEVKYYSLSEAAKALGCSTSLICVSFYSPGNLHLLKDRYIAHDGSYSRDDLPIEIFRKMISYKPISCKVTHKLDGSEKHFASIATMVADMGFSKKTVYNGLKLNSKITIGNWHIEST